ncbi:MAG TPA: DNA polymerase I [Candidatus Omnitrophota bacterium]|mgnify:CR=1 FL=1|nr:DNA polymerase I [Candidatus Omnitrophota bacterium]HQO57304.1 DNA polymerase I [Candidatus Omnitrophota bacterium]
MELYLIDAHALCYRSFYAIKDLANSKGQKTNAVYGFVSTLKKLLRERQPEYMAVCFDSPARTLRQEKYADYKIQRPSMPDDLRSQLPLIKDVVMGYRIPVLEYQGYEADDIIATLAGLSSSSGKDVVIVSDDKDMFQLVNDHVRILSIRKDSLIDAGTVKELLGVAPEFVTDFIALAGDKVDNIPGVRGIGEASARHLIEHYGHLEEVYRQLDRVEPKSLRERLEAHKEDALLSKELAELDARVPGEFHIEDMRVAVPDHPKLLRIFSDLEFKRFVMELREQVPPEAEATLPDVPVQGAEDMGAVREAVQAAREFTFLFGGAESEETWFEKNFFIACPPDRVWKLPLSSASALKSIFSDDSIRKNTFDYKRMLKRLATLGMSVSGDIFDAKLAAYLLSAARGNEGIWDLGWEYLKLAPGKTGDGSEQARVLLRLIEPLRADLVKHNLVKLCSDIEIPLSKVLWAMEEEGVKVDVDHLKKLSGECDQRITALHQELFALAGEEFNLNSPKQLSHILFTRLKLPALKRTKTGYSTNEEVLTRLALHHPLPALILEYRQLAKLKSTYIDALPKLVDSRTRRIHATFNQTGTETGRLSSHNPNLQNIPVRTELGREIRKAFIPSQEGHWIVSADYSQIELRVLAHLSQDDNLLKAFRQDQDIHTYTAGLIFDVPEPEVSSDMRASAKRVNFGIIYGMSAFGLAKDLNIPQPQAADFIDRYFLRYPRVKIFMDEQVRECEEKGYVMTLLQRRRYIPDILSRNMAVRQFAQRQAINTPVQGTAADMIKLAMIRIYEEMSKRRLRARMIITVHDELVFDVPDDERESLILLVRDLMENTLTLDVPVKVSIKYGPNWLQTQTI